MVKGFRPGKEPPELRKQRAKQRFGELNPLQERLVEVFAERGRDASLVLIRRWRVGALTAAIVLAMAAAVLTLWSRTAAIVVGVTALLALFFWWRMHRQREAFEEMADVAGGAGGGKRR